MYAISIVFALLANICFASASLIFTDFSRRTSVYWMNMFKCGVSALCCGFALVFLKDVSFGLDHTFFLLSGIVGLMVGDIFLLKAFTYLGAGRSLVLFGFQPLFLGIAAFYLFGQKIYMEQFIAIIFLVGCLITFSLESHKINKTWGVKGLVFALVGVCLDASGILLTKYGFEKTNAHFFEANFVRSIGAFLGFLILSRFIRISFTSTFKKFSRRDKTIILLGSFCGTFLSLSIYMAAIKIGHLASISAIAVTGPFTASTLECLIQKKSPSKHLVVAFIFFFIGFFLLIARNLYST